MVLLRARWRFEGIPGFVLRPGGDARVDQHDDALRMAGYAPPRKKITLISCLGGEVL